MGTCMEYSIDYSRDNNRDCCVKENCVEVYKALFSDHTGEIHEISFDYCSVCGNHTKAYIY
jgi:hypothetical protein